MTGGDDNDRYWVDNAGDLVVEVADGGADTVYSTLATYTLTANVERGVINTSAAANLTGNTLANILTAGAGDNVLDGAGGTDLVSYASASSGVTISLALSGAQKTGGSGSDTLISIENLTGSSYADRLTGDAGSNSLQGGAGAGLDTLDGGIGADTMTGGDGNDRYHVDNAGDLVVELAGGGADNVYSTLAAYTLVANVERGTINTSAAADLTGNALANILYAGAGNNALDGADGTDLGFLRFGVLGCDRSSGLGRRADHRRLGQRHARLHRKPLRQRSRRSPDRRCGNEQPARRRGCAYPGWRPGRRHHDRRGRQLTATTWTTPGIWWWS